MPATNEPTQASAKSPEPQKKRSWKGLLQAGRVQWLTLLVLLVPIGWYGLSYVPGQRAYLTQRNFRQLNKISEDLKLRVENSATTLKNLASTARWYAPTAAMDRMQASVGLVAGLDLIEKPVVSVVNNGICDSTNSPAVIVAYDRETGLTFECQGMVCGERTNYVSLRAKRDFANVVTQREEFDAMLLADADGRVLFQRSVAGWTILDVNEVSDETGRVLKTNLTRKSSAVADAVCGGTKYKIFLQPVTIGVKTPKGPNITFWVCGMVETRHFLVESLAFPHRVVVRVIFLALALAVSMPFLKMPFMGPRAPLRPGDALLLSGAAVFAAGLITFWLLDLFAYHHAKQRFNEGLRSLATSITGHVRQEVEAMTAQLRAFNDLPAEVTQPLEASFSSNGSNRSARVYITNLLNRPEIVPDVMAAPYPFFEMATWLTPGGQQARKWTIREFPTPFINLKGREYFVDALARRHSLYEIGLGETTAWVQPIVSWNTGESSVVVSVPHSNGVVAIESRLLSLISPVLPPGFGFVIVSPEGQALLHSDATRNLQENILQECDYNPLLRAALLGGHGEPFNLSYRGRNHAFYVSAMPASNWSLVVFREALILNHANFDTVFVSLSLFGMYFVLFGGALWCFGVLSRKGHNWLWPDASKNRQYGLTFVVHLVIAGICSLLICFSTELSLSPPALAILSVLAVALGSIVFRVLLKKPVENPCPLARTRQYSWQYVAAMASFLLVTGAVPAFGIFKLARDSQIELLVMQAQLRMARDLGQRTVQVENSYRGLISDSARMGKLLERRLYPAPKAIRPTAWDLYLDSLFGTEIEFTKHVNGVDDGKSNVGQDSAQSWFGQFLALLRPVHHRTMSRTRDVFRATAVDHKWEWRRELVAKDGQKQRLILTNRGDRRLPQLVSTVPALNLQRQPLSLVILATILGAMGWIAHFVTRYVFAHGLEGRANPETGVSPAGQNRLILVAAGTEPSHPWIGDPRIYHLDLRKESEWTPWLMKATGAKLGDQKERIVMIHHLEYRYDDPESNTQKLQLFEKLLADNRRTVAAVSWADPSNFRFADAEPVDASDNAKPTELGRWLAIFDSFVRDYGKEARPVAAESVIGAEGRALNTDYLYASRYAYYRALWTVCSRQEQLALHQLSRYGLLNARNTEVSSLLERGLIVCKPNLQLFENGFARFVQKAFQPQHLPLSDQEQAPSVWKVLKKVLLVVLYGAALFLFLTQREQFTATLTLLTGFTAGVPVLMKFLNLFSDTSKSVV